MKKALILVAALAAAILLLVAFRPKAPAPDTSAPSTSEAEDMQAEVDALKAELEELKAEKEELESTIYTLDNLSARVLEIFNAAYDLENCEFDADGNMVVDPYGPKENIPAELVVVKSYSNEANFPKNYEDLYLEWRELNHTRPAEPEPSGNNGQSGNTSGGNQSKPSGGNNGNTSKPEQKPSDITKDPTVTTGGWGTGNEENINYNGNTSTGNDASDFDMGPLH